MRICLGCGKSLENDHPRRKRCRPCVKAHGLADNKARYHADPVKHRAIARRWQSKNRKRYLAYKRKWKSENRERQNKHSQKYRVANREACNARSMDWAHRNRARLRANGKKRYAIEAKLRKIGTSPAEVTRYIQSIVPRNLSSELFNDVVSEIWLAMCEGTVTLKAIVAGTVKVSTFIALARGSNLEGRGYAQSLDVPRRDGRSWHDVLRAS